MLSHNHEVIFLHLLSMMPKIVQKYLSDYY